MNFELARQLKDAGFPIKPYPEWALKMDGPMGEVEYMQRYVPTLSELIEACGDKFASLVKWKEEILGARWSAYSREFRRDGRTREEAVASLWLALNAKP